MNTTAEDAWAALPYGADADAEATSHARIGFEAGQRAEWERIRKLVHEHLAQVCLTRGERSVSAAVVRQIYRDILSTMPFTPQVMPH